MKVLTLVTQKGGPGKTTLAANLAVAAALDDERVIALDLDVQGTLGAWGDRRGEGDQLAVFRVTAAEVAGAIANARRQGIATLVILDTPGVQGPDGAMAVKAADFALVPVRPSLFDIEAAKPVVRLLDTYQRRRAFVLNQVSPASASRNADAARALMKLSPQNPLTVALRSDFQDAAVAGQGVMEFAPKGKAAAEIATLWAFVKAQLHG